MLQVTIPGKLIISGEHAVLYGSPALAAAIERCVQIRLTPADSSVEMALAEYQTPVMSLSLEDFWKQFEVLESHYHEFLQGDRAVGAITTRLYDLPLYALGVFLRYTGISLDKGVRLIISGDLPMGYGLGSSAAVVVGILRIASQHFQYPLSLEELLTLAKQVENLQHGLSSGIDPSVCLYEGVLLYTMSAIQPRSLEPWPAYLINTGQPASSTGECVEQVKARVFPDSFWAQFTKTTLMCDEALKRQDPLQLRQAISQNHRLLCEIGVVPDRIQLFIKEIEALGGAAKICGAGCVKGDNAGFLLLLPGDHLEKIEALVHEAGFTMERTQLGVKIN